MPDIKLKKNLLVYTEQSYKHERALWMQIISYLLYISCLALKFLSVITSSLETHIGVNMNFMCVWFVHSTDTVRPLARAGIILFQRRLELPFGNA